MNSMPGYRMIATFFKKWISQTDGVAAAEAALVFPVMLVLLLGVFDVGNGILANQKTIRASQVVADLITRERVVNTGMIDEAINAGELAFQPMATGSYGVDIVSIRFDEDAEPEIVWRETLNMEADANVLERTASLADPNNGVVVVIAQYLYEPVFAGFVSETILMQEVAFARGRRSAVVNRE